MTSKREQEQQRGAWRTFWLTMDNERIEIFESPAGHWYRRARAREAHDLLVEHKAVGLPATRLVSIEHWRNREDA